MGLRWLSSMSVGVAEFDNHQHMLLLLREIAAALLEGNLERARSQANKLQTLAGDHIAREEAFLRRIGFPGWEAVMAVQRESLSRIAALKDATPGDGSNPIASMAACRQSTTPAQRCDPGSFVSDKVLLLATYRSLLVVWDFSEIRSDRP
jgi:hypothetical protein